MAALRHVYIHVPFCSRRCAYCDFSIAVRKTVPVDEYLGALETELRLRFPGIQGEVDTIYFGGGTPSRLGGEGIARAIELVRRHFPLAGNAELTIEANPEDVSEVNASRWRDAGVNRLSLGAQSFDANVLHWMHRTHGPDAVSEAVETARQAGIRNLSLDLIFALPEELERNLQNDIRQLLALEPDHISLYGLTVESHTPLGRWVDRGVTAEREEGGYEAEYLLAHEELTRAGLEHYEVSNYGRPGRHSRHNSSYWTGASYAGLGPSAHEFNGDIRRWNTRHYRDWVAALAADRDPIEDSEALTPGNRIAEAVYLGLRTQDGLALSPSELPFVEPWVQAGWITVDQSGVARCTPHGWLRLDALATALTHHRSR